MFKPRRSIRVKALLRNGLQSNKVDESQLQQTGLSTGKLYERLHPDHIRLIRIKKKVRGVPYCELATFPRKSPPEYIAISYTWGAPEDPKFERTFTSEEFDKTETIVVNGTQCQIRRNLHDLFKEICCKKKGERLFGDWLWIDVLCINQVDKDEKSEQVNRMAGVYESAARVVVWLGQALNTTERVLMMFHRIYEMGEGGVLDMTRPLDNLQLSFMPFLTVEDDDEEHASMGDWMELLHFCKRTWFQRLWTLEESVLSPDTFYLCGQWWLDEEEILAVTSAITGSRLGDWLTHHSLRFGRQAEDNRAPMPLHTTLAYLVKGDPDDILWGRLFKGRHNVSDPRRCAGALLDYLLECTAGQRYKCYDPLDRIFACLGMAERALHRAKAEPLELEADYKQPVVEVYTAAMTYILKSTRCLTPLLRSRQPGRWYGSLPSWVLDFEAPSWYSILDSKHGARYEGFVPYNASRDTFIGFEVHQKVLIVHSYTYATVTHVGDSWEEIKSTGSFEKTTKLVLERLERDPQKGMRLAELRDTICCYFQYDSTCPESFEGVSSRGLQSFLALLMGNRIAEALEEGCDDDTILNQMKLEQKLAELDDSNTAPSPMEVMENYKKRPDLYLRAMSSQQEEFLDEVAKNTYPGRRVFLLDNGEIGLGHHLVEPEDKVCIISDGGRVPVILRKQKPIHKNRWNWIGEAYVHSLMFGAGVDQMEREGKTWQQMTIV